MRFFLFFLGTLLIIFPIFGALVTVTPEDKIREDEEQMEFLTHLNNTPAKAGGSEIQL